MTRIRIPIRLHTAPSAALLATAIAAAALFAGCAGPVDPPSAARAEAIATPSGPAGALEASIEVGAVTGGRDTNPLWASNVASTDFEHVLEGSLRAVGMLAPRTQAGRYQLMAHLARAELPEGGSDLTVTTTVDYALIERASGKTVLERTISTPFTARAGDAFLAAERLRMAHEGSVRSNIRRLLAELGQTRIEPSAAR